MVSFGCSGKATTTSPLVLTVAGWSHGNGRYATLVPGGIYGLSLQLTAAKRRTLKPVPKKKPAS